MGNIQLCLIIAAVLWVFFRCYYPLSVTLWLPPANWQGNIKTCIVFSGLYYCWIHWTLHCVGRMLKIVAKLSTSRLHYCCFNNEQCKNTDNWPTFCYLYRFLRSLLPYCVGRMLNNCWKIIQNWILVKVTYYRLLKGQRLEMAKLWQRL